MNNARRSSTAFHGAISSQVLETDEKEEREREEWVAYWVQRRKLYDEMLRMAATAPLHDEDILKHIDSKPCSLPPEVKRALKWMFVYIVSLTIINAILWWLYLFSCF